MCTAITFKTRDSYFGRNLDYTHTFGEKIIITPRKFSVNYRNGTSDSNHNAIIGMGIVADGFPLYFDAINEKGLGMAGLNFPGNACYFPPCNYKENITSYEFILKVLSECENVEQIKKLCSKINITNEDFSESMKTNPLHWIAADREASVTIEQTANGLVVYDNQVGVLTNNPSFDMQMFNLNNYRHLSDKPSENEFSGKLDLKIYSLGMGGIGMPGDLSSQSRFVKAAFTKFHSVCGETEEASVSQFFHILYSVYQQRGCVLAKDGYEITNYTSCCNLNKGIYYYTTYNNHSINGVSMYGANLCDTKLKVLGIDNKTQIKIIDKF